MIQIVISLSVNALIVFSAAHIARFLQLHASWAQLQKWPMGSVLSALAVCILLEQHR
ncbi:hypothetical protein ACX1N0_12315 [Acinetobacter sp. ANC 4635]|uniref:hypothetical protein n=1 Tax=Acinetobacter sp. ANC 4635 TaxID=2529846 RepID=UPI003A4C56C1